MNIKHLQYIVTIADEKNISKAAEKLFMSQSSLSYFVSTLEKEIGTPLFTRQKNGVRITDAGKKYVDACKKIIKIHDDLYDELASISANKTIVVSTGSVWGSKLFAEMIPKFQKHYPGASFQLSQTEYLYLESEIEAEQIDFAFLSLDSSKKPGRKYRVLRKEYFYFAVPANSDFALKFQTDAVSLEDIFAFCKNERFIMSRKGSANYNTACRLFHEHGFNPVSITEVNGLNLTRDLVAGDVGVTFIPESGKVENPNIRYYSLDSSVFRYNVLLTKPLSNFNDTEKAFYHFILNYFKYISS